LAAAHGEAGEGTVLGVGYGGIFGVDEGIRLLMRSSSNARENFPRSAGSVGMGAPGFFA